MVISLPKVSSLQSFKISLRVRCVIVQNKKSTPVAPNSALMMLSLIHIYSEAATQEEAEALGQKLMNIVYEMQ